MISYVFRLAQPILGASIFAPNGMRQLRLQSVKVQTLMILIGLILAMSCSIVTYPYTDCYDSPLCRNYIKPIGSYDTVRGCMQQFTIQRRGEICSTDIEKTEHDGFNCQYPWPNSMLRHETTGVSLFGNPHSRVNFLFKRLKREVTKIVLAEPILVDDFSNKDPWLVLRPVDYLWIACAIGANVVFIIRKVILVTHGYKISNNINYDHNKLQELANKSSSHTVKTFFTLINILFPALIISGIILIVLFRAIPEIIPGLIKVIKRGY